jgi:hypothetical protein
VASTRHINKTRTLLLDALLLSRRLLIHIVITYRLDQFNGVFCSKKKAHEATAGRGVRVVLVLVASFVVVVAHVVVRAPLLVVV